MDNVVPWLTFFVSAAAVAAAGSQLARQGDRIAEETGIGGLWIGVILMATATSLPEVVTTATAAWIAEPDLAAGDLFGANMTNMMTLAVIAVNNGSHVPLAFPAHSTPFVETASYIALE